MQGLCWISTSSCYTIQGVPYCKMLRDQAQTDHFVHQGYISEEGKDPIPFFGKRTDRASAQWKYYAEKDKLRFPLIVNTRNCMNRRGCEEVSNGDTVKLQGYRNRQFIVSR